MAITVSVVIPTYNRAQLIAQCIESLRASGVSDLEIVVADDGSSDDTEAVARSYDGVVYVGQANAGPAAARNRGFLASRGRYVTFLDSDDEWIAGAPERLIRQLDDHPDLPLLFADTLMGNETDGFASFVETYGGEAFALLPSDRSRPGLRMFERRSFFHRLSTRNVMFLGSLLVRREAFEASGGFDVGLRGAADWEFFMRMASVGATAFSEGPAVSRYFKRGGAMSDDADHMERDFILALDAVRQRCALDHEDRDHIEQQLRRHLFGWAHQAYDRGQLAAARARFAWAKELGQGRAHDNIYLAASYCPPPIVQLVKRARGALGL